MGSKILRVRGELVGYITLVSKLRDSAQLISGTTGTGVKESGQSINMATKSRFSIFELILFVSKGQFVFFDPSTAIRPKI